MAPEVVLQLIRGYNNLVDSWSVGVIIFKMLTGKSPFIEDSTIAEMETCVTMHKSNWKLLEDMNISKNGMSHMKSFLAQYNLPHSKAFGSTTASEDSLSLFTSLRIKESPVALNQQCSTLYAVKGRAWSSVISQLSVCHCMSC